MAQHAGPPRGATPEVVAALREALDAGEAVAAIDEVWQLGRAGRGRLVVVQEDDRAQPAREADGRLVPATWTAGWDVMGDPVDEIIEYVVRSGGSAEFVAPGALAEIGRIGLLRHSRTRG